MTENSQNLLDCIQSLHTLTSELTTSLVAFQ